MTAQTALSAQIFAPIIASIIIPIAVARIALRAQWRRIGQAFGIWWLGYGLAFSIAGMNFERMMAWSKYFNVLWTIPGVLILVALLQKFAPRPDTKSSAAAPAKKLSLSEQWATLKPEEKRTTLLIIVGFFLFLFSFQVINTEKYKETLRTQFHLPKNASFEQFRYQAAKGRAAWPNIEGVVRFSEDEYRAYMATMWTPGVWKAVPFEHGKASISGPFAADAYAWRSRPPAPVEVGDHLGKFGFLSLQKVYDIKRGRYFCFIVRRIPGAPDSDARRSADSCWSLQRGEDYVGYVAGAIDEDTRTLHMIID